MVGRQARHACSGQTALAASSDVRYEDWSSLARCAAAAGVSRPACRRGHTIANRSDGHSAGGACRRRTRTAAASGHLSEGWSVPTVAPLPPPGAGSCWCTAVRIGNLQSASATTAARVGTAMVACSACRAAWRRQGRLAPPHSTVRSGYCRCSSRWCSLVPWPADWQRRMCLAAARRRRQLMWAARAA